MRNSPLAILILLLVLTGGAGAMINSDYAKSEVLCEHGEKNTENLTEDIFEFDALSDDPYLSFDIHSPDITHKPNLYQYKPLDAILIPPESIL